VIRRVGLLAGLVALLAPLATHDGARAAGPCLRSTPPYAGIPGASLTPTDYTSKDDPPVPYTRWRGTVPGFDGLPFSVDVTVPCGTAGPLPTIVMAHGFTDDKTVWEETGKGDRSVSASRPEQDSHWNNVWFVSRGYAVLNYTARGWHDSCGPDTPGATKVTPAPQCADKQYWIHLDDKRWEVRDAQWLTGGLVQSRLADPARLAMTGGSYGGAPTAMAALLAGKTMCGASAVPASLGPDPCAGKADGDLVAWTTPDGRTPLVWAAAVPMYTFADLIQVLAPNGRGSDGWALAPADGNHSDPFGVPIQSTVAGLLAAGETSGFFAPPAVDPTADIVTDAGRLLAGNPFLQSDPLVARGVRLYRQFKSPITTPPQGRVPIFWVQGLTDPLFPAFEVLQIRNVLRSADTAYPIKVFLADVGHDYTAQRQDEWDLAHATMNDFLDHYLRPDRTPAPPSFDMTSTVTRCLDHDAPLRVVNGPSWDALHTARAAFVSTTPGTTASLVPGPSARATDPITTATLPLPGAYKGCRITRPSQADPTAATYEFPAAADLVLMGGPVLDLTFTTTAPDTELNVRLWDVAADGSAQGLVTRGTYRSLDAPGSGRHARFQIAPQGYRFPAGHKLKVEVAANDAPYFQQSNIPAVVQVQRLELTLPLYEERPATASPNVPASVHAARASGGRGSLPATGGTGPEAALTLAIVGLLLARRRHTFAPMEAQ
jgi:predicted acyl esterase